MECRTRIMIFRVLIIIQLHGSVASSGDQSHLLQLTVLLRG